ncbi:MAG: hypothetical protein A2W03_13110 [Candidatus Aminicenantes bacterium RBG_16_63_16]|nr:MAG: hypothetical protein A2W03_13110 [Candidatus Aminicenantes bacterium RBG_16_63_16]
MKKTSFLLVFLGFASWVYPTELRILGGVNLSKSTEPVQGVIFDFYYKPVYGAGAILGGGLELTLTQRIALEVDALYFQKGSKIKIIYGNVVGDPFLERMDELSFPILFKYYFKQGSSPYVLGGGELAIVLAKDPKNIDIGLVFGAGFRKQVRSTYISLEGRYHHGLKDTTTGSWALRKMRVFALIVGLSI